MNTQNYLDEMNTKNYLDEMKKIQGSLLQFLESQNNSEENYQLLFNLIEEQKILDSKYKFTSFLHLISKVSNNHYRDSDFFNKIEQILKQVNGSIAKYLTNTQTFNIFKGNKRVLLYLIEEKIIIIDQYISKKFYTKKFSSYNYPSYFAPEIRPFLNKLFPQCLQHNKELPKDFYELRKIGENETEICSLIRKDLIKDFIVYINQNNLSCESKISSSIYETNPFLYKNQKSDNYSKKEVSLIEYAAFYGSIQIFKYLKNNQAKLEPIIWIYAIHGNNSEIIHLLEEENIKMPVKKDEGKYNKVYREAIRCHHNDIVNYIVYNYINNDDENKEDDDDDENKIEMYFKPRYVHCLKNFNFNFLEDCFYDFTYLCKYDYSFIVNSLLKNKKVYVNQIEEEWSGNFSYHLNEEEEITEGEFDYYNDDVYEYDGNESTMARTPLYFAVIKENPDIVELLLNDDEIDVNCQSNYNCDGGGGNEYMWSRTSLFAAVKKENVDIVKLLLSNNSIDVNEISSRYCDNGSGDAWISKKTALYLAVEKNNEDIVKLLLMNNKIDVNIFNVEAYNDYSERTALSMAVEIGNIEIIKLLLNNDKIDINILNKYDNSYSGLDIYGYNINSFAYGDQNRSCFRFVETTALEEAEKKNCIEIIELLSLAKDKIGQNKVPG